MRRGDERGREETRGEEEEGERREESKSTSCLYQHDLELQPHVLPFISFSIDHPLQ